MQRVQVLLGGLVDLDHALPVPPGNSVSFRDPIPCGELLQVQLALSVHRLEHLRVAAQRRHAIGLNVGLQPLKTNTHRLSRIRTGFDALSSRRPVNQPHRVGDAVGT